MGSWLNIRIRLSGCFVCFYHKHYKEGFHVNLRIVAMFQVRRFVSITHNLINSNLNPPSITLSYSCLLSNEISARDSPSTFIFLAFLTEFTCIKFLTGYDYYTIINFPVGGYAKIFVLSQLFTWRISARIRACWNFHFTSVRVKEVLLSSQIFVIEFLLHIHPRLKKAFLYFRPPVRHNAKTNSCRNTKPKI